MQTEAQPSLLKLIADGLVYLGGVMALVTVIAFGYALYDAQFVGGSAGILPYILGLYGAGCAVLTGGTLEDYDKAEYRNATGQALAVVMMIMALIAVGWPYL